MAIDLRPPKGVRAAAARGIELVQAGKAGGGFEPATLQRARKIAAGEELTPRHVMRMYSFFARHAVDRRPGWGTPGDETPGYVAWMAWGGDAGASWSREKAEQIKRARAEGSMSEVLSLADMPFSLPLDPGEHAQLAELLDDVSEAYGDWEDTREDEHEGDEEEEGDGAYEEYASRLLYLLGQARMRTSQIGDEIAADGGDTTDIDRIDAQLQAMARTFMRAEREQARAMQVAMRTYDDEGMARDEPAEQEFEVDEVDDPPYEMGEDAVEEGGPWTPRQLALYEAIEDIAETYGKFDRGIGPDGIHYVGEDDNPFREQGMRCASCIFFEGGGGCELVEGEVHPDAVCKFWIIPAASADEE